MLRSRWQTSAEYAVRNPIVQNLEEVDNRRPKRQNEQENTGTLIAKEAKQNPVAELSPEMKVRLENSKQMWRMIEGSDQENAGSFNLQEVRDRASLRGYAEQKDQSRNAWQAFATLSKEQQQQVIQVLEQCPELITSDFEKQQEAIAKAIPKGLMNLGQHTIEAVLDVGRAAGAVMEYCENSRVNPVGTRAKAAKAIGEGLAVGVNVFIVMPGDYLHGVGGAAACGDTGKAFRDVAWLGQEIDQRWQTRSEAQKLEIATELTAGFMLPGAAARVAKSEKLTTAIAELSRLAGAGPENRQKLHQGIEKVLDNVLAKVQDTLKQQPMMLTPEGMLVPLPARDIGRVAESELGSNVMEMTRYFEHGKKTTTPASEVAQKLRVSKQELKQMTEEQLEARGIESIQKRYDLLFYNKYPHLKGAGLAVHHALPQKLLDKFTGLFKAKEVNSVEYLQGIPKNAIKDGEPVHKLITNEWEEFLAPGRKVTRAQVLEKLRQLDEDYGRYFKPPHK